MVFFIYSALFDPRSPLRAEWNPLAPLTVNDPVSPLTAFKLRRALADPEICLTTLAQAAEFTPLDPFEDGPHCGIANRIALKSVAGVSLRPVETSCETALRLALWAEHGVKPAARAAQLPEVAALNHIGSYNCRSIRGTSGRMSTHATAQAIDITGVTLKDGRVVLLLDGWNGKAPLPAFFTHLRDTGCDWFETVLGPEYNVAHADHFHFQAKGWGTCR